MSKLTAFSVTAVILIYLVMILGGYVKSVGAGLACGTDWPTCKGYIIPPDIMDPPVSLEYTHRVLAMLSTVFVLAVAVIAWSQREKSRQMIRWATLTAILLAAQVVIGMVVVKLETSSLVSTIHLALATATFGAATVAAATSVKENDKLRDGP